MNARNWVAFVDTADFVARQVLEGNMAIPLLDLKYEDLVADTSAAREAIFGFMDLDSSLAAPPTHEGRTAAGFGREDPTSHFRAGRVGDWQSYATGSDGG
jgi:hypothetical protein